MEFLFRVLKVEFPPFVFLAGKLMDGFSRVDLRSHFPFSSSRRGFFLRLYLVQPLRTPKKIAERHSAERQSFKNQRKYSAHQIYT